MEALKRRKTERLAKPGTNRPAADAVPVEDPDEELSLEELTALWFEEFGVRVSVSASDDAIIPRRTSALLSRLVCHARSSVRACVRACGCAGGRAAHTHTFTSVRT